MDLAFWNGGGSGGSFSDVEQKLLTIQIRLAAQAQVCLHAVQLCLGVFPGHGT